MPRSISVRFAQQPGTPEPPGTPPQPPPDPTAPPPYEDPPRPIPIPRPDEPPVIDDPPPRRNAWEFAGRLVPLTTISTCRLPPREQTVRVPTRNE
ncbi:MAG: hypothetical protein WBX30_22785 [Stellaceae bacterium]